MKAANKELKGMMKTVRIEDIDVCNITVHVFKIFSLFPLNYIWIRTCFHNLQSMQDEMMDLMDVSNEIQETLGRSYSVPDDIDEEELICSWPFLDDSNTRYYHPKVTESNSLPYSDNQPGTTRQFKFCSWIQSSKLSVFISSQVHDLPETFWHFCHKPCTDKTVLCLLHSFCMLKNAELDALEADGL